MIKKEKLIILSDFRGNKRMEWINQYFSNLKTHFEIEFLDSQILGEIDSEHSSEEEIHNQFVSFGIEKAIENLLQNQKNPAHILGFSVGGTIAWKANLKGLKTKSLTLISATRIRYETEKPEGILNIIFGENDSFKPKPNWFKKMKLDEVLLKNEDHVFYKNENYIKQICRIIIDS